MTNRQRKSIGATILFIIFTATVFGNSSCSFAPQQPEMREETAPIDNRSSVLAPTASTVTGQKIAIPSYFYPCNGTTGCYWTRLNSGAPTVGLAIINPNSGPGAASDPNYVSQTLRTQAVGIIVLGYVYTSYGRRAAANVQAEVDRYYQWYGVDGIFFDEAGTKCNRLAYYQSLYNYVKASHATRNKVVLNPGINTSECYMQVSDIIVNFEDTYSNYVNWQPSGWEFNYPADRFWHLVISTSKAKMPNAIQLSKQRQAGWVYVTPDVLPNPWDTLPPAAYWNQELSLVAQ